MGTAKAAVLILTIKAALVGGPGFFQPLPTVQTGPAMPGMPGMSSTVPEAPSMMPGGMAGMPGMPGMPLMIPRLPFGIAGGNLTYDRRSELLIVSEPSPQAAASLFRPGQYVCGRFDLQEGGTPKLILKVPELAGAGGRTAYLEAAGPGLYRRKDLAEDSGYTVTVSQANDSENAVTVSVTLTHQQLTPQGIDPALGAYVGRPSVRKREVCTQATVAEGKPVLLYWGGPPLEAGAVGLEGGFPGVPDGAPMGLGGGLNGPTSWTPASPPVPATPAPVPGPAVPKAEGMTTLSGIPIMGQLFCVQQSQPLTVLLEVKRQGGEALAELGQPIAPPRMGFAIDRELIEAKIKELEASLAGARAKLNIATEKLAIVEAQAKAGLVTADAVIDEKGAIAQAEAEQARIQAEIDTQRILLKRAGGGGPAQVTVIEGARTPKSCPIARGETLESVLKQAGALGPECDLDHVVIIRRTGTAGQVAPVLCVSVDRNALNQPAHLQDGDTVYVPEKTGNAVSVPPATFMPGGPAAPAPPAAAPVPAPAPAN